MDAMENPIENLSPREREIYDLLLEGVSPKEIARRLKISTSTVDFHRTKLYNKLDVHSIQELIAKYGKSVLSNPPESLESKAIIPPAKTKKTKRLKLLPAAGIALLAIFGLLIWILTIPCRKPSAYPAPTGVIIPVQNMVFSPKSDKDEKYIEGNSTSEVFVSREKIDGTAIDNVLNIKTNLVKGEKSDVVYAQAHTRQNDVIQRLRRANGIRFKARGDGKSWSVGLHTIESNPQRNYIYSFGTVRDQVIVVDVPYSSLCLPDWWVPPQYSFDFNKETITELIIEASYPLQGYGSSSLQIFDFEIY